MTPPASPADAIVRLHPAIDALLPEEARVETLATGFLFTEGPLWRPHGALWFSDIPGNVVREWTPDGSIVEVLRPGGYDGHDLPPGFIGPNGMTAGPAGTVTLCQHGNRRVVSVAADRSVRTIVDRFEGKRLNSPNDVVYARDGAMYFTDPPYGLPKQDDDPAKELPFNGVFRWKDGDLQLLTKDLARPNGLAFSPDGRVLYVANSDDADRFWMRYDVRRDGSLEHGEVFAHVAAHPDLGLPDGLKIDEHGHVWATGPAGIWIFTPGGQHLGTIKPPEQPANIGWGDDGRTLYITAGTGLYRIRTSVAGQPLVY
jgi:gluconolactonase